MISPPGSLLLGRAARAPPPCRPDPSPCWRSPASDWLTQAWLPWRPRRSRTARADRAPPPRPPPRRAAGRGCGGNRSRSSRGCSWRPSTPTDEPQKKGRASAWRGKAREASWRHFAHRSFVSLQERLGGGEAWRGWVWHRGDPGRLYGQAAESGVVYSAPLLIFPPVRKEQNFKTQPVKFDPNRNTFFFIAF